MQKATISYSLLSSTSIIHITATMFRPTLSLLATPASSTLPLKRAPPMTLLRPRPLYRRLLRLHRKKLNPEERIFGDTYLKAEFRRHRDIENPLHIVGFLQQWQTYGEMLDRKPAEGQGADVVEGEQGDGALWLQGSDDWAMETLLERMNDQQVGQVWELYNAIQKRHGLEEGEGPVQEGEVIDLDGKKT